MLQALSIARVYIYIFFSTTSLQWLQQAVYKLDTFFLFETIFYNYFPKITNKFSIDISQTYLIEFFRNKTHSMSIWDFWVRIKTRICNTVPNYISLKTSQFTISVVYNSKKKKEIFRIILSYANLQIYQWLHTLFILCMTIDKSV